MKVAVRCESSRLPLSPWATWVWSLASFPFWTLIRVGRSAVLLSDCQYSVAGALSHLGDTEFWVKMIFMQSALVASSIVDADCVPFDNLECSKGFTEITWVFFFSPLSLFLTGNEHILPNKHHKQPLILNWRSLGACRVRQCFVSVWFQPNRGIGREAVLGKTAVHRSKARRGEQARGEEQDTGFGCMCDGTRRKYRRKVQKTQRDLFGNPAWKLSVLHTHTHTHTLITHDRFIAQHTRKTQGRHWV